MGTRGVVAGQLQPSEEPAIEVKHGKPPQGPREEFQALLNEYVQLLPFQFTARLEALVNKYHSE